LNPYLFPQSGKHTETVYKIVDTDTDEVVAYGERFNSQANKHLQDKLEQLPTETVSCAAITITLPAGKAEKYQKTDPLDEQRQYKVYFAHSGLIAKKNTLRVLSLFRDAGIDVKHSAIKNTLREQLYHGEQFKFPVTTILGVKEVQDNTIIVRNNQANRQKAVPLSRMCAYVKRQLR
jgi:histidyl-tRNA synthetase